MLFGIEIFVLEHCFELPVDELRLKGQSFLLCTQVVQAYDLLNLINLVSDLSVLLDSCEQESLRKGVQNVLKFIALAVDFDLLRYLLPVGAGNV